MDDPTPGPTPDPKPEPEDPNSLLPIEIRIEPSLQLTARAKNVLSYAGLPSDNARREIVADALRQGTSPAGAPIRRLRNCGLKTFSEICRWAGVPESAARAAEARAVHVGRLLLPQEAEALDAICRNRGITRAVFFEEFAVDPLPVRADLVDVRQQAAAFAIKWLSFHHPQLRETNPEGFRQRVATLSEFAADYLARRK